GGPAEPPHQTFRRVRRGEVLSRPLRAAVAGVDVLDEGGARPSAVRLPQLLAVDAVVGGEEQVAAHRGQGGGPPVLAGTATNVLDQDGARSGAVRSPQLLALEA